ncbi:unnamed protein product, partial [Brassica oleracea]
QANQPSPCWSEPSLVPECLLSSLENSRFSNGKIMKEQKKRKKWWCLS